MAANKDDVSKVGGGLNPLKFPKLLELILDKVPIEDLKDVRLVDRLWRDESLNKFRKSLIYVLDPDTESERLLKLSLGISDSIALGTQGDGETGETNAIQPMYKMQTTPWTNYRLSQFQEFPPRDLESFAKKSYFWDLCGQHVTYLSLEGESCFVESMFIDGLIWLLKACPNMRELRFAPVWGLDLNEEQDDTTEDTKERVSIQRETFLNTFSRRRIADNEWEKIRGNFSQNLKVLSIIFGKLPPREPGSFTIRSEGTWSQPMYSNFYRCMFALMPTIESLSLDGNQFYLLMNALNEGTPTARNGICQLKNFEYNDEHRILSMDEFSFNPLLVYLERLELVQQQSSSLQCLTLKMIPFKYIWQYPNKFWNVLFRTRRTLEKFTFGVGKEVFPCEDAPLATACKFDLFNFKFPQLNELTLVFGHRMFQETFYNFNRSLVYFDFSLLRGTPNLVHFRLEYLAFLHDPNWLRRKLTKADLEGIALPEIPKWHLVEGAAKQRHYWGLPQDANRFEFVGDEVFNDEEARMIQLDKLKTFYFTGGFTAEAFFLLGAWMKNLKEIAVIFDNETLSIPFVVWPGTLKKVTVLSPSFEGEGISAKLVCELDKMYPEIEIDLEGAPPELVLRCVTLLQVK